MIDDEHSDDALDTPAAPEQAKPLQMARLRRQLAARFFHVGPPLLGLLAVVLISIVALFYLNEVSLAAQARLRLQQLAAQQTQLQQQNQQLQLQQGALQSPGYIEQQATHMGMIPEDPGKVQIIHIPG